ncbi:MAG: MauE/DoxX family redox-associated membrane protein [Phototrophicaceae bacterium]
MVVAITRFIICFIFLYSFITKLHDFKSFENAILNFQLLPKSLHRVTAIGLMLLELLIVVMALFGGTWLFPAYGLSIVLLAIFIYVLNSVLQRKIQTSCNCFGTTEREVSVYDIWRNVIICLVSGIGLLRLFMSGSNDPDILNLALSVVVALVVSLLILNLRELAEVLAI